MQIRIQVVNVSLCLLAYFSQKNSFFSVFFSLFLYLTRLDIERKFKEQLIYLSLNNQYLKITHFKKLGNILSLGSGSRGKNMQIFGSETFKLYLSMALPWDYPATRLVFFSPVLPFLLSILPLAFLSEFSQHTSSFVHLHSNQLELKNHIERDCLR